MEPFIHYIHTIYTIKPIYNVPNGLQRKADIGVLVKYGTAELRELAPPRTGAGALNVELRTEEERRAGRGRGRSRKGGRNI